MYQNHNLATTGNNNYFHSHQEQYFHSSQSRSTRFDFVIQKRTTKIERQKEEEEDTDQPDINNDEKFLTAGLMEC